MLHAPICSKGDRCCTGPEWVCCTSSGGRQVWRFPTVCCTLLFAAEGTLKLQTTHECSGRGDERTCHCYLRHSECSKCSTNSRCVGPLQLARILPYFWPCPDWQ